MVESLQTDVSPGIEAGAASRLPVIRTSFVGRASELEKLLGLVESGAVVTITGSAGSGKTRLAAEAAHRLRSTWEVTWADLASLSTGELVPGAVATALRVRGRPGVDLVDDIVALIGDRRRLLILDNCEHLIEAAADLCENLVTRCTGLVVLATSRISLRISGESVFALLPLAPEGDAIKLFVDRARSANAGFTVGPANERHIEEICRRLDGLPLAIELAASWVAVMSPSELVPLLDRRLDLLESGRRTVSARQRTLRSAIDWSYELLAQPEQLLFRRLAVFAGSFTREAAERVCSDESLRPPSVIAHLARLCASSMVAVEVPSQGLTRYRLLESLRAYAAERLDPAEREVCRDRHLRYFSDLAEEAFQRRMRQDGPSAIELLEPDRENIRAALEWGADRDPERALGLAAALVEDLRRSLFTFGEMRPLLEKLVGRASPDSERYAWALVALGYTAFTAANDEEAMKLFGESVALFQKLGDAGGEAWGRLALGHDKWAVGDVEGATKELRLSEAIHARLGNRLGRHRARLRAAVAEALEVARRDDVRRELEEAVKEGHRLGDGFGAGMAHNWLGMMDLTSGDKRAAQSHFLQAIPLLRNDSVVAVSFFGLAACCLETDPERSLRLIGAGEALQPRRGRAKPRLLADVVEQYQPRAAALVGEEAAERAFQEGCSLSQHEAIDLALSPVDSAPESELARRRPGGLTRREAEIAALVADGLTNRQIAEFLHLSVRTVETHVDRILTKLGFHNRTRLSSWVREQEAGSKIRSEVT